MPNFLSKLDGCKVVRVHHHKILGGLPKSNTYTHRCIGFVSFLGKKSLFKLKEGDYNIVHKALRRINAGCEQAKYCVKT